MLKVSIICPLHNKGAFVCKAIESIQSQTCAGWECLVIENGSTDFGPNQAKEMAASDSKVRFFDATGSIAGPGAARNFGLDKSTGEWILFLDADDFLEPDHLKNLLFVAEKFGPVDIVAGGWKEFETNIEQSVTKWPSAYGQSTEELVLNSIAFAPWAVHSAMIRRDWLQKNSLRWFEDLDGWPSEDTAFWFAVLQGARVAWANSASAIYRTETPNSRNSSKNRHSWLKGLRRVINKNLDTLASFGKQPSPAQIATLVRMYESRYLEALDVDDKVSAFEFQKETLRWLHRASWFDPRMCARKLLDIQAIRKMLQKLQLSNG